MKNEKLKNCLDDAVSGIRKDPWLLRKVISRAESMEDTPVKKKLAFGTVQVVLAIILLMSVGIASISSLNNTDSLKNNETIPTTTPAFSGTEAEGKLARLQIGSLQYDGYDIAFLRGKSAFLYQSSVHKDAAPFNQTCGRAPGNTKGQGCEGIESLRSHRPRYHPEHRLGKGFLIRRKEDSHHRVLYLYQLIHNKIPKPVMAKKPGTAVCGYNISDHIPLNSQMHQSSQIIPMRKRLGEFHRLRKYFQTGDWVLLLKLSVRR